MNILYIGAGFVGACSAAAAADSGHRVLAYDTDAEKVKNLNSGVREKIESVLFEDELAETLARNQEKIIFTADYAPVIDFLDDADAVFLCLPTPEKNNGGGETDLSFYEAAVEKLAQALVKRNNGEQTKYIVVVNKSTVPVNLVERLARELTTAGVRNFGTVANPEFLVEGEAMNGSLRPERVVVGAENPTDFSLMRAIYARFCDSTGVKYVEVNPQEAAAGKLLANYLLFNRVATTFAVVGRICEAVGEVKFENLRQVVTTDRRIGHWGFYDSVFAGGSCFIKDALSLARQMEDLGLPADYVRETLAANYYQRDNFYARVKKQVGGDFAGRRVAFLGLAFKQGTNDVRNSPAVDYARYLIRDGVARIQVYDPEAQEMFKRVVESKEIKYCRTESEALADTDICFILTDWPQFKLLTAEIKKLCPLPYLIADGRRMLAVDYDTLRKIGYNIVAVGENSF